MTSTRHIARVLPAALFLLFVSFMDGGLKAEVIDRIAALVNGKIITASDARKERALEPVFSEPSKDDAAILQDLIERILVADEISQFPDIIVTDEEVDTALRNLPAAASMPQGDIRDALRYRMLRARYFDYRFRQFIVVTDEEIQKYYDDVFVPEARTRGLNPIPGLAAAGESIRNNIIDEKMVQELESWLDTIRRRSDIEIFK